MTAPAAVIVKPVSPAVERAMPKSMISAWSSASTMMLAGFRSRWTTLASCAAASPETTCRAIPKRAPDGHPALARQDGRQVGTLDVRHRDVLDAVDLAEVVNADDVPVSDLPGEQQLALEPLLDLPRGGRVRHGLRADDLDRNRDFQLLVPRLVDRSHAASAEQADDVVAAAELLADMEWAGRGEGLVAGSTRRARGGNRGCVAGVAEARRDVATRRLRARGDSPWRHSGLAWRRRRTQDNVRQWARRRYRNGRTA